MRRRRWFLAVVPLMIATIVAAQLFAFSGSAAARPLRGFSSCGDLLAFYQEQARQSQNGGPYYGIEVQEAAEAEAAVTEEAVADESAAASAPADQGEVSETGTNVQERGVDESDIIKTDGAYLYILRPQSLLIARINADGPVTEVGRIPFDDWAQRQELLIGEGKAVVVRQLDGMVSIFTPEVGDIARPAHSPERYRAQSEVLEIDLRRPSAPRLLRDLDLDGEFISARMVDGAVRIVMRYQSYNYWVGPWDFGWARNAERDAEAYNEAVIEGSKLGQWHPLFGLEDYESGEFEADYALACDQTFAPDADDSPPWRQSVSYMLSFDLADGIGDWGSVGVMSDHPTVYASTDSLYLATPKGDWRNTAIHRFDIGEPLSPSYFGSGAVRGRLLSQWSMSEHDGYLRVATTIDDHWPWVSNVFVLEARGEGDRGALEQVGLVSGLGVTEEIKSVRFAGDVGYVVTFRLTDPLYVLDLSDPADPTIAGRAEDSRLLQVPASAQRRLAARHRPRRRSAHRLGARPASLAVRRLRSGQPATAHGAAPGRRRLQPGRVRPPRLPLSGRRGLDPGRAQRLALPRRPRRRIPRRARDG